MTALEVLDDIRTLLTNNGPMGVSAIAKQLSIPSSTVDKYLKKQKELIQDDNKKWRLPDTLEDLWSDENMKRLKEFMNANTYENIQNFLEHKDLALEDILWAVTGFQDIIGILTHQAEYIKKDGTRRVEA